MAITDAQFTAWLRSGGKQKCVLGEFEAYSGGSSVTRYVSNGAFVSTPTDTPANTAYVDLDMRIPFVRSQLSEAFRSTSRNTVGDVVLDNSDGTLTPWLADAWDGRALKLYLGDAAWSKADFRPIFTGVTKDIYTDNLRQITLQLRDKQIVFDVPAMTTLIGGAGVTKDQRRPICYGQVFNVPLMLIDSGTRTYAAHDGAINAVTAVRENGKTLVLATDYTVSVANGTITMLRAVTGQITADVQGSKTGGVYLTKTADIAKRFITERTTMTAGEIDATAFAALVTLCPQTVGFYVSNDADTVADWLDALFTGIGGFYYINRAGQCVMGQFTAPTGTPAFTVTDDDIEAARVSIVKRFIPSKSVRIGYARNFEPMTYVDASLNESDRELLSQEYQIAKAVNTVPQHLLAVDDDIKPSLFANSADAAAEATRQAALWGIIRVIYRATGFSEFQQVQLNSDVTVTIPLIGLNTVAAKIVGMEEDLTGQRNVIEFFV